MEKGKHPTVCVCVCVSFCICVCVRCYLANMAVVASLLSVVVSSTTLLVVPPQCLLDRRNPRDLKLWLMLTLSRHGEPFFLSLSRR